MTATMAEGTATNEAKEVNIENSTAQSFDESFENHNGVTEIESLCMNCHENVGTIQ
jgi:hypothetical protein